MDKVNGSPKQTAISWGKFRTAGFRNLSRFYLLINFKGLRKCSPFCN